MNDIKLSNNFYLSEFTSSATAEKYGLCTGETLCIEPTCEQVERLQEATNELYQKLRDRYGPMICTSGLRHGELNELVGGSPTSAHLTGDGADFFFLRTGPAAVMAYLEEGHLNFDQAILYPKSMHLHLGYRHPITRRQRKQLLIQRNGKFVLWSSR